jgi:hypothetical protein
LVLRRQRADCVEELADDRLVRVVALRREHFAREREVDDLRVVAGDRRFIARGIVDRLAAAASERHAGEHREKNDGRKGDGAKGHRAEQSCKHCADYRHQTTLKDPSGRRRKQ